MTELEQIQWHLDQLAGEQAQREIILLRKQEAINTVLLPTVRAQLAEIEAAFAERVAAADKDNFLHAIWTKARVSWDTRGLDGYMVAHPEMGAFRSVGKPSVSLRRV